MTLAAHLHEARTRLMQVGVGLLLGSIVGYLLSDQIIEVLEEPIVALAESRNASLNFDSVSAAFDLKMKIAVFAGVIFSSPLWLHQLFAFFMPGLNRREKKYVLGFVGISVPLFAAGCWVGFELFPHVVQLLASIAPTETSSVLAASEYFDFVMKLVFTSGAAFVLPVFIVLLNFIGVLSGQAIVKSWRIVLLGVMLFSALATPSADGMSMFLIAAPMTVLFATAAGVALLHDHRAARRAKLANQQAPELITA